MDGFDRLGPPLPQRVGVIRALRGLGDLLVIVPALRALRSKLPQAKVELIGLPSAAWFVDRFRRYVDGLVEFPGFPGIPEWPLDAADFPARLAGIQARQYDLVLQMHGSGTVINSFAALLGARQTAGFYMPGFYNPDPERFLAYPDNLPEIRRHLKLMEFLGAPSLGEHTAFPLAEADRSALHNVAGAGSLRTKGYVCVHPGAHEPERRWPAQRFAEVADALAAQGLQVVLTGTAGEAPITAAVAQAMRAPAIDLAGKTSLGALAALLVRSALLVTNDTGVSHLASALTVPSVVVFIASNPGRWAPLNRQLHRAVGRPGAGQDCGADGAETAAPLIAPSGAAKRRCFGENCFSCVGSFSLQPLEATVEMVLAQARELLAAREQVRAS